MHIKSFPSEYLYSTYDAKYLFTHPMRGAYKIIDYHNEELLNDFGEEDVLILALHEESRKPYYFFNSDLKNFRWADTDNEKTLIKDFLVLKYFPSGFFLDTPTNRFLNGKVLFRPIDYIGYNSYIKDIQKIKKENNPSDQEYSKFEALRKLYLTPDKKEAYGLNILNIWIHKNHI
jgi:hypothetical protein